MQIQSYNRRQLKEFIDSEFYRMLNKIPISRHRAISQINNPDCDDEDILLWSAYDDNSLIGYVGALPGFAYISGENKKIYWLSCFWVDENYRKGNLASSLFFPLMKQYGNQLLISNFIPSLESTYQSIGIFQPTKYHYKAQFYLRFSLTEVLAGRFPKLSFLKPLYRLTDWLLNGIGAVRKPFLKTLKENRKIVTDKNFDKDFQDLLNTHRQHADYIKRDADHFEWIIKYPWVLQDKPDNDSKRYYFSSKALQFEYQPVKIYHNDKLTGFALLKIRDKKLTVSYLYADNNTTPAICSFLMNKAKTEKLKMIITFDERLSAEIKKYRQRYIIVRETKEPHIFAKKIDILVDCFQEGDGDKVFT